MFECKYIFFLASPIFESEPLDTKVFLDQIAVFECRVSSPTSSLSLGTVTAASSTPDIVTVWLKDDQPLLLDHRMKVLPSGQLEISGVRISDRAEYRCQVSNSKDPQSSQTSRSASLLINLDMGKCQAILTLLGTNNTHHFLLFSRNG